MITNSVKKYALIFTGSTSLALGIVGIFVPVLPTTPFLLLSSFCYIRSSKRLHDWLINHKLFGSFIYNYINYGAVKRGTKIGSLIFLWAMIGSSIYLLQNFHLGILLLSIGFGVSIHILTLKTLKNLN
ncbi:MAG: YbaN family protein [Candidatus Methanofastidiosum sp.]|nr:YbaN family protein [Methanofastidiosum sp.]